MVRYILKRLLLFIPVLGVICVLTFFLSKATPSDQVIQVLELNGFDNYATDHANFEKEYTKVYKSLHLNKPDFYFSIVPRNYPKTINQYTLPEIKARAEALFRMGYSESQVQASINNTQQEISSNISKSYLPKLVIHGLENQFHYWLSSIFNGGSNISIVDGRSALTKIREAIPWTFSMIFFTLIVTILFSVVIGSYLSLIKKSKTDSIITTVLYLVYAIPTFWLASMLVVFFTSPTYGSWLDWFPSTGVSINSRTDNPFVNIARSSRHLILPTICLIIHSLPYVIVQMRSSMSGQLQLDYMRTARAKGLSMYNIIKDHGFKNAVIPMITIFVAAIPQAVMGSLVIEIIFNIPGMGRLTYDAIMLEDWNVVFSIVIIIAIVTMISYLVGDILYALVNPKIRFPK